MSRILLATYMVRYPLGGMLSWALQYALGLHRLGHDVHLLERANYPDACFDPEEQILSNSPRYGYRIVKELIDRFGMTNPMIFESFGGELHGASPERLAELLRTADLMIDIGNHGAWLAEVHAFDVPSVLIDGEPGFTQMKMLTATKVGAQYEFTHYFTNGANIGTKETTAPSAGKRWRHVFNPVDTEVVRPRPVDPTGSFTTVMNWQSHKPIIFGNKTYGQKDVEFAHFIDLPSRVSLPLEIAVSGSVPAKQLTGHGWRLRDAHEVTRSFDAYHSYLARSLGEFSVCKNVFVATRSGWFSDRSAAYLASGRPVVLQDTGFSLHLPCGEGLFAVHDIEEAAAAILEISTDYERHSKRAREIADAYLDARKLLGRLLAEIGF